MMRPSIAAAALGLLAVPAAKAGGPLQIVDDPALGRFIDISLVSEPLKLAADGEIFLEGTFPGNFVFGPGQVTVGQNGGLAFGQLTIFDLTAENAMIPSRDAFAGGQSALVLWDDIDDKEGDTWSLEMDDRLVVQWRFPDFDGTGSTLDFQAQVFHNAAPTGIYAQFLYEISGSALQAGGSATIGYQDGSAGFGDVQFSFNRDTVVDGTVLNLLIPDEDACWGDTNEDGTVSGEDLINVILDWGTNGSSYGGDVNGSGHVDLADLLAVINAWGPCGG